MGDSWRQRALVEAPLDTEARVAHESFADEIITELDFGTDIQVRTFEPSSNIVP